jgi:hypothetical protein
MGKTTFLLERHPQGKALPFSISKIRNRGIQKKLSNSMSYKKDKYKRENPRKIIDFYLFQK